MVTHTVAGVSGYLLAGLDLVSGDPHQGFLDASGATLSLVGPVGAAVKAAGRLGEAAYDALHLTTSFMSNGFSDSSLLISTFGGR